MEGDLPPRVPIVTGAPVDLGQHFGFAPQPQVVQVDQATFVAPTANLMQEKLGNGAKPALLSSEENGHSKAVAPASQWRRVKWDSIMVKLLVSAVSYIDDDIDANVGSISISGVRRMGKWKLVSMAMTKRGFPVSPQQCEDKFHDLNKKYRRVTEILGRGTACQIVEKPVLLEQVNLPARLKEEAKKFLSSKHLHYEQMCSYNNRNRVCLLDDPALQRMLQRMARGYPDEEDDQVLLSDGKEKEVDDFNDDPKADFNDDLKADFNDDVEDEITNNDLEASAEDHRDQIVHGTKKPKHDGEEGPFGFHATQGSAIDITGMFSEGSGGTAAEKNPSGATAIQIEGEHSKIKRKKLKIKQNHHLKWLRSIKETDKELLKMRLENEKKELQNKRLELELKLKETEMGIKPKSI